MIIHPLSHRTMMYNSCFEIKTQKKIDYRRRFRDFRAMRRALAPFTAAGAAPALKPGMPAALPASKVRGAAPLFVPAENPAFIPRGGLYFPFVGCGLEKPFDGAAA